MNLANSTWRKCSTCKKDIALGAKYYECSVSTCTGQRTGYVFCSISCWEVHLPGARHRDAGAVEKKAPLQAAAPSVADANATVSQNPSPRRIIVGAGTMTPPHLGGANKSAMESEVLVVVSKMKQFIRDVSEMNTAEEVNQVLSNLIRQACRDAIDNARADGRKTVMARDFK
jgi:hypothetical protein